MRTRKIRGHNRIQKRIKSWSAHGVTSVKDTLASGGQRDYHKIYVYPWFSVAITNSVVPQPYGTSRAMILNTLVDVYESWRQELEELGEPYYLKIWLYRTAFSQSQVVWATGDFLNFYDTTFAKPDEWPQQKPIRLPKKQHFGPVANRVEGFTWEPRISEYPWRESDIEPPDMWATEKDYQDTRRWFDRAVVKPHRTSEYDAGEGPETVHFFFEDVVWIGSR